MPRSAIDQPTPDTAPSGSAPRRRHRRAHRTGRRKGLRAVYFSMAAVWGCVAGSSGVLAVAASRGQRLAFSGELAFAIVLAMVAAIAGGLVSAAAYREARKR